MKTFTLPLFSVALLLLLATAACNQTGESNSSPTGEGIATELAQGPTDGSFIVDGVKQANTEEAAEDIDHDLIADASDNCPTVSNQDQADEDSDGIGNACANL